MAVGCAVWGSGLAHRRSQKGCRQMHPPPRG